eukprot:gene25626-15748_t
MATYDTVLANGRCIDPETGLDGIRHVGIKDDVIVAISETPLCEPGAKGLNYIDTSGLVVSP